MLVLALCLVLLVEVVRSYSTLEQGNIGINLSEILKDTDADPEGFDGGQERGQPGEGPEEGAI